MREEISCQITLYFFPFPQICIYVPGDLTKNIIPRAQVLLDVIEHLLSCPTPVWVSLICLCNCRRQSPVRRWLLHLELFPLLVSHFSEDKYSLTLGFSASTGMLVNVEQPALRGGGLEVERGKSQFVAFASFRGVNTPNMAVWFKSLMVLLIEYICRISLGKVKVLIWCVYIL